MSVPIRRLSDNVQQGLCLQAMARDCLVNKQSRQGQKTIKQDAPLEHLTSVQQRPRPACMLPGQK